MFGNSLAGATQLIGERCTLVHVTGESYDPTTGKPTTVTVEYPTIARVRALTDADARRLGADLVKTASAIAVIPVAQLAGGVEPSFRDQLVSAASVWEILRVRKTRAHGIVIEYQCQVGETGVRRPPTKVVRPGKGTSHGESGAAGGGAAV